MTKLTNLVLAAMIAAPFVIKYLRNWSRKRRLLKYVTMKASLKTSEVDTDSEDDVEIQKDHFLRIPAFAVAAVIGKRGVALRRLMNDTQTECVIRSYTPEELDVVEHFTPDIDWSAKFGTEDWFEESDNRSKITYLLVRTNDENKLKMIRLRIAETIETVRKPWKEAEFLVDSSMVGYLVGRGGRNIKSLRDKFNVHIQISDPNPDNPEKSTVHVRSRDATALREVEIVMTETVLPKTWQRVPRFDEDWIAPSGIYEDVDKELEDLQKVQRLLAQDFD